MIFQIKYYRNLILLLFLTFLLSFCKVIKNNNVISTLDEKSLFDRKLEVYLSGFYFAWDRSNYEYEIKTVERKHILAISGSAGSNYVNKRTYEKELTDNEMIYIYDFIKNNEPEQKIKNAKSRWTSAHDFNGSVIINIDNLIFENIIYSDQDFENNLYMVLNFLNNLIDDEEYIMPIRGVGDR